MPEAYIKRIVLKNYKGFESYEVTLKPGLNVLAGANNAGKSTLLSAMRLLSVAIHMMKNRKPNTAIEAGDYRGSGWLLTSRAFEDAAIETDNLYYEFDVSREVSIVAFSSDNDSVTLYWPSGDVQEKPYVYYSIGRRAKIGTDPYKTFKNRFPSLGAIPVLNPLDVREYQRELSTCKAKFGSKVSSRYFRNALYYLDEGELDRFAQFLHSYTPEMAHLRREISTYDDGSGYSKVYLNFFYDEKDDLHPRELRWAGDGFQIWMQLLFHIWQRLDQDVLILDEPDVFLHPDLLARLSRLIQIEFEGQVLVATHSVEFISSVSQDSIIWIDRNEPSASRVMRGDELSEVLEPLGSGFYFTMNRALRQECVLFVEGSSDFDLIRAFSKILGFGNLSRGIGFSVVYLEGIENRVLAEHFRKVAVSLGRTVKIFVLLDGDGRSDAENSSLLDVFDLSGGSLSCHIWARRDFESYLLVPTVLSKLVDASLGEYNEFFEQYCMSVEQEVRSWLYASSISFEQRRKHRTLDRKQINALSRSVESRFAELWSTVDGRIGLLDPKDFIKKFRSRFSYNGSLSEIAESFDSSNVAPEIVTFLGGIEKLLSD